VLSARRPGRVARTALAFFLGFSCGACAATSPVALQASARDRSPRIEDAFDGEPALLVVVRPAKLTRDPLYGPLIRTASRLAAARAAVAEAVGSTTLAVVERSDEVICGVYDRDARDAVVAFRGVPADAEPSHLVDTNGKPLWAHVRDLPGGVEELSPAEPTADAALFALPRRAWVIAVGGAIPRARAAYVDGTHGAPAGLGRIEDAPVAVARLRGDALVRARPSLMDGPLAPIARGLDVVTFNLEPGSEGAIGEVVARFVYAEIPLAERAAACANDVVAAFVHKFEAKAPWLHAVKVSREERAVIVRGRIPRAWADGLIHVDLGEVE
jgi:hypothetical protein